MIMIMKIKKKKKKSITEYDKNEYELFITSSFVKIKRRKRRGGEEEGAKR